MHLYLGIIYLVLNVVLINCNEFKLSESKILLPRTSFLSINYTIKGSPNICHEWISETPEVVAITPIYDPDLLPTKCSQEAIITSVWRSNNKITGTVYAKNIATGHSVKCDVIIDQIKKLTIETRTLELFLHETPEALIARAYDENGNTFSTLDGIPFEWLIRTSGSNGDSQNVLRFITWTESEYATPPLIGSLEKQGLQGYMQLVSGLKTGAANVSLSYRDDKMKSYVTSNDVRLLVMANAALSPSLAYLIPHTQLTYKIVVRSQGSTIEVKMPNDHYYLKINNTDLAELDDKSSTITAKKYGQTEIILIDKNINENFRHPSSLIFVVEPGYLTFHISPCDNHWVLQTVRDNIYTITVRPFDFNNHQIVMSDNIRLETTIPKEYFEVLYSSPNGTHNVVRTIKEGQAILSSKLMHILLPNGTKLSLGSPVEGTQDLIIFPPINIVPKFAVLPWYPDGQTAPGYLLIAIGGSGEYKWIAYDESQKTSNPSVSVDGKGNIKPLNPGIAHVIAADQRNLNNKGIASITVSVIQMLEFILDRVEVEVNNEIDLPILASDENNHKMSHCHWLPFKVISEDEKNIEIVRAVSPKHTNHSEACALLRIRGVHPGFSKITISLPNIPSNKTQIDSLSASITVGCYIATKFINPSTGSTTIGLRSIRLMNIINGPLPWVLNPSQYFFEMREDVDLKRIVSKISLIEHRSASKLNGLLLKVQCKDIGELNVPVAIGNKPSMKNPHPIVSIGTIKLICTVPVRMKLVPKLISTNFSTNCPFKNTSEYQHISINNKRPLLIEILLTDKNGVQLERSESFAVKVEIKSLSKKNIKTIVQNNFPPVIYSPDDLESPIISSKFFITPYNPDVAVGEIEIIAKINSYRDEKGPALNLEAKLQLQISKSMEVQPEKILLYQHEKVSSKFSVKFGSGHFIISSANLDFLSISKMEKSKGLDEEIVYEIIQHKVDFSQRKIVLQISDACFDSVEGEFENLKTIEIELVKPTKLQLVSLNRVQLGSQINLLLQVFDDTGREFPQNDLHLLNLDLNFNNNSNIISAQSLNSKDWDISPNSGFLIKISGEKLGFESLFVKLQDNANIISNILKIEVFPPIQLVPKYIVLLTGAEIQLTSKGGPQNCHDLLHYSIIKNTTLKSKEANIEFIPGPNGLVKAINHGEISVMIQVDVSDSDPSNNNEIVVLSKDDGRVGVVQIKGMKISSPTKNLLAGNSMPLWITFIPSSNDLQHISITGFSMTGSDKSDLSFKWYLNPPGGVLSKLENILEPTGINVGQKYFHCGMRLTALNPGKQSLEVSALGIPPLWLSKSIKSNSPMTSKLNIGVIPKLEMLHPVTIAKTILLPPSTKIHLKSSLDNVASVIYTLIPHQTDKSSSTFKSKIHSDNILETNPDLSGNEVENFILHVASGQSIKMNSASEIILNQTVAVLVTVKHPTYSMLSPYIYSNSLFEKFQSGKELSKYSNIFVLPLGGPYEFQITNHDELGNIFDVSPDLNMFSYRLHRSDNIEITFSTFDSLKKAPLPKDKSDTESFPKFIDITSFSTEKFFQFQILGVGDNTIQLYYHDLLSDYPKLIDIICLPTGSVLHVKNYPQTFSIEGNWMKYEAPFDGGYWYSSDREVVDIDTMSGESILKQHGSSNIFYSLTNSNPNIDKLQNKDVLISNELTVHAASKLSMKIFDGSTLSIEDPCAKNECVPINLNYQWNSLMASIYVSSSKFPDYRVENNFKFEKQNLFNISRKIHHNLPIECDINFDTGDDSSIHLQDIYRNLFKSTIIPVNTEFDNNLGAKQWACFVVPNTLSSFKKEEFIHLILTSKSSLNLIIRSRLRYSNVKPASISVPVVLGYVLLMDDVSRTSLIIKESGEVLTSIRLALPGATRSLIEENRIVKLSVSSSRPSLVEILAPREDDINPLIWIYPLKAVVIDKIITETVDITIDFPITKQRDVIRIQIDISNKVNSAKTSANGASDMDDSELSKVSWLTPVLCVLITAAIAIAIVMLINHLIQPKVNDDKSLPSPGMKENYPYSRNSYPYAPLHTSMRPTQHIWNNSATRRNTSPLFNEYFTRSNRFPSNTDFSGYQDFGDVYK